MKKLLLVCAVMLCTGKAFSQDNQEIKTTPPVRSGVGVYVDPVGFITFGPMAGVEVVTPKGLILDAHLRLPGLGVMSYLIDDDPDELYKITGIGMGVGIKRLFPSRIGGLYAGGVLEAAFQKQYEEQESSNPYVVDVRYVAFLGNVGYKFQYKSGFFMNAGVLLGPAYVYRDAWTYDSGSTDSEDPYIQFAGFVTLALGFMF